LFQTDGSATHLFRFPQWLTDGAQNDSIGFDRQAVCWELETSRNNVRSPSARPIPPLSGGFDCSATAAGGSSIHFDDGLGILRIASIIPLTGGQTNDINYQSISDWRRGDRSAISSLPFQVPMLRRR